MGLALVCITRQVKHCISSTAADKDLLNAARIELQLRFSAYYETKNYAFIIFTKRKTTCTCRQVQWTTLEQLYNYMYIYKPINTHYIYCNLELHNS